MLRLDERQLADRIAMVLNDWPSAGLAVAVVRDGSPTWLHSHGVADVATGRPVTGDTVFRIASLTKTITAVAVLQLWEQGLVDLDAPATTYLRTFRLVPARAGLAPATVRHLLTHTAGIGYWRRWSDLLRPAVGSGVSGRSVPPLADYYRRGLPVEIEPGTKWAYSNHGFATLGQIVEDVTGEPYDRYLRAHVFGPMGMERTDLVRSERVTPLATGYVLGRSGLRPAPDSEVPLVASGGVYSTAADMARYVATLLQGGAGEYGTLLKSETVAMMFAPQFQPDPRMPGMGLGFELGEEDGHRTATKSGTMLGFLSQITLAPDDGIGIVSLVNTGGLDGRGAPDPLGGRLIRHLLGLPDDPTGTDLPPRPEVWRRLCGWYTMDPGPMTNLFNRLIIGAGAEVAVRRGQLWFRPLSAIPTMRRGFPLHPDAEDDPYVFRLDFSELGIGTLRVAFRPHTDAGRTRHRLDAGFVSLQQRPDGLNPKVWAAGGLAVGAVALAGRGTRRRVRARRGS